MWLLRPTPNAMPYSVEVKSADVKAGEGLPRRHFLASEKDLNDLADPLISTVYESFLSGCKNSGSSTPYLSTHPPLRR